MCHLAVLRMPIKLEYFQYDSIEVVVKLVTVVGSSDPADGIMWKVLIACPNSTLDAS